MAEDIQKLHYDKINAEFDAHYNDACSKKYREEFFYKVMFDRIDLTRMKVLEAMCGTGSTTAYLLDQGADVTGIDISSEAIKSFQSYWPKANNICASILDSGLSDNSYDIIAVIGGLHHLPPNLSDGVKELHRILKPGGYLCFVEPHKESLPEIFRQLWYKFDNLFESNEEAVDITTLKSEFSSHFHFNKEIYQGNLAYLLVFNSMVFRIPIFLKPFYTPLLMKLERLSNQMLSKYLTCYVVCQWQKK